MLCSSLRRWAVAAALIALALSSCKGCLGCKGGKPDYDRSTPVETINSFSRALEAGRIPEDTIEFFVDPNEVMAWRLRCKGRGCNRAVFKIDEVVSEDEYAARYLVTFDVFGKDNLRVMSGRKMPITFAYQNGVWYFDQIGKVTEVKLETAKKVDAGAVRATEWKDAAAPTDAGAAP